MTITSGFARRSRRSAAPTVRIIEAPAPDVEPIGLDGPETAHGGHPRRTLVPPVSGGLVKRVRSPVVLPTRVRRIRMDASGVVDVGDQTTTCPAPMPDCTAEVALLGR